MIMRKLVTSAVATLGLFVFGAVNSANAGQPVSGSQVGRRPVVNASGKIGKESGKFDKNKFDKERKEWEYKHWDRYSYDYCFPGCSYPVETCAPVCEVPVCREPVFATSCYEYPCSYDYCRSFEFHEPCYDSHLWHREHPLDNSKPTTASSHRNTENLGSMAHHMSGGKGRR
jgi:hypothetical protein